MAVEVDRANFAGDEATVFTGKDVETIVAAMALYPHAGHELTLERIQTETKAVAVSCRECDVTLLAMAKKV